jgi:uncharacterized protein YabN with tetrapyrrole methylase and pyrophosphatase domain
MARFRHMEDAVRAQGREMKDFTLAELDGLWNAAKAQLRAAAPASTAERQP